MAKKSDREAMAAALGGMVSRPTPEPPPEPAPEPQATPKKAAPRKAALTAPSEAAQAPRKRRPGSAPKKSAKAKPAGAQEASAAGEGGGGHRKTGNGYVKADGTRVVRMVVVLTEDERQRAKMLALEAGLSPSDYVRRALGFV